jgi:endonuclease/exonuclease/phosphatase family metal-dependent hydrolase
MGDFDVLCLQEVAVNFPGLAGSRGEDQVVELSRLLPGYSAHFGAATDVSDGKGGRSLFGNLILSRLPVLQVFRHLLPWPADPAVTSMQRIAVEVVVEAPWGPLRVTTSHLEFYSTMQRMAQVEALRRLHAEACAHARNPRPSVEPGDPFTALPRPASALFTADFNFPPQAPEHARMTAGFDDGTPPLLDAWAVAQPGVPHHPTAGVHENSWAKTPYCCDFFFLTPDLARRVPAAVDARRTSDHQPYAGLAT